MLFSHSGVGGLKETAVCLIINYITITAYNIMVIISPVAIYFSVVMR